MFISFHHTHRNVTPWGHWLICICHPQGSYLWRTQPVSMWLSIILCHWTSARYVHYSRVEFSEVYSSENFTYIPSFYLDCHLSPLGIFLHYNFSHNTLYTATHTLHTHTHTHTRVHTQILQDFPYAKSKHEALMHKIELLQSRITQAHRYYDRVSAEVDRCEVREFDIEVSGRLHLLMRNMIS